MAGEKSRSKLTLIKMKARFSIERKSKILIEDEINCSSPFDQTVIHRLYSLAGRLRHLELFWQILLPEKFRVEELLVVPPTWAGRRTDAS